MNHLGGVKCDSIAMCGKLIKSATRQQYFTRNTILGGRPHIEDRPSPNSMIAKSINTNPVPPPAADASDDDLVDVSFGTKEVEEARVLVMNSTEYSSIAPGARRNSSFSSRHNLLLRHSSDIFHSTLKIFQHTNGNNGASVNSLRGSSGADFEGHGVISRATSSSLFDCSSIILCGGMMTKKDKERFLLIKGYHCFVFDNDEGMSPKYAIELMNRKAFIGTLSILPTLATKKLRAAPRQDTTYATVHLETSMGDVEYKITFSDSLLASKFCDAVMNASTNATSDEVRKRLGHEKLLNKRASVRFANTIGASKVKDQPTAPVSVSRTTTLSGMSSPGYNY